MTAPPLEHYIYIYIYMNSVREHYTMPGVVQQVHKFLKDPFGPDGGELRCAALPPKDH